MSMNAQAAAIRSTGWLKAPAFDIPFVGGALAIALAAGALVSARPDLFLFVLLADLWILGYHHVVATYTRLTFDKESFAQHRGLVLYLPFAVVAAVAALALTLGIAAVATIYLYWQWWHYTRQSEGISKAYAGRSRDRIKVDRRLTRFVFYALPIAGILLVSARSPAYFIGMPVYTLPVPFWLAWGALMIAASLSGVWIYREVSRPGGEPRPWPYIAYVTSHFVVFAAAYVGFANFDIGWLVINIWHNMQYILFVWLFNNRRFKGQISEKHRFLSGISRDNKFVTYFLVCLGISTLLYLALGKYLATFIENYFGLSALVTVVIIYQSINFHHYIVDSRIWKLRKKPIKANLGLT